jgi:hypothetical protein
MNVQLDWAAIQPFLTPLLKSPQFQSLLKQILDDIMVKIAGGVHPDTAVKQATGQIGAAAMLHLTGNPIDDVAALLKPKAIADVAALLKPKVMTPPGTFTS